MCSRQRKLSNGAGAAVRKIPLASASLALRVCDQKVDESSGDWTLSPSDSVT